MPASRPTLGVSSWPDFDYDASGATTLGVVEPPDAKHPDALRLRFDVRTFEGPPVCGRTTRVFGVPFPRRAHRHRASVSARVADLATGACALDFDAEFRGSIFGEGFVKLPAMTIRSPLTTGAARARGAPPSGNRSARYAIRSPNLPSRKTTTRASMMRVTRARVIARARAAAALTATSPSSSPSPPCRASRGGGQRS